MQHGLLLVDKPSGCTSHDVVVKARRLLRQKKIGHCGTLDPAATGLLLLTVGRATRLTRFLIRAPKVYEGTARFGVVTDTYDLTGEVVATSSTESLDGKAVAAAMEGFVGNYLQTPPPYCAKKVGGVKYYELARRGEQVPDDKKEVTVFEYRPLHGPELHGEQELEFLLSCSSGTYARSLVHELGQAVGCGAALAALRRIQIGSFKVTDATTLVELERRLGAGEEVGAAWVPFDLIQLPFDEVTADSQQERRLMNGQTVLVRDLKSREGDWLKVLNERQEFIAVGSVVERIGSGGVGVVQPKVVFHQ